MKLTKLFLIKWKHGSRPQHRPRVPAIDRPVGWNRFNVEHDRRGSPILVACEPDGAVVAIVPGGTRLPSPPDQRDLPLLWRYARWRGTEELARDLAPDFVIDMGLAELVDRHRAHSEWMLERSSRQLAGIVELLGCGAERDDVDVQRAEAELHSKLLAYRRALYVFGELKAAVNQYSRQMQEPPPELAGQTIGDAQAALSHAKIPIEHIEDLMGRDCRVTITRGFRRWHGEAYAAILIFLKLHEAERALAEDHPTHFVQNRLRLLERALGQALPGNGSRTALAPLRRRCRQALELIGRGHWTKRDERLVHTCLLAEIYRLGCAQDQPAPQPSTPTAPRPQLMSSPV